MILARKDRVERFVGELRRDGVLRSSKSLLRLRAVAVIPPGKTRNLTLLLVAVEGAVGVCGKRAAIVGIEAIGERIEIVPVDRPQEPFQDGGGAGLALYAPQHMLLFLYPGVLYIRSTTACNHRAVALATIRGRHVGS